ncbi:class I SAM-dependent methyltransferase [Arsenicicoccus dermatophilus]|uniref:class I SAM-dependent methyltransferase n=1 Tax=Arsenicicoccus dermatophilus TaxID=1076331 RepID=UPI001F4D21B6|nr:class I SAM-dependent methyltransferase [Arsenicicoccus dermatophilus]MCH8613695.1 class I SAM-dependent methyltransferase [Arsenicicoccus dermatophilus]
MPLNAEIRHTAARLVRGAVRLALRVEVSRLEDELRALREQQAADTQRIIDHLRDLEIRDRRDLYAAGERAAVAESARWAAENLVGARSFGHPHETLRHALSLAPTGGLALEFGVFQGATLRIIAEARGGREVYGFDSFEGLPEDWRVGFPAGAFGVDGLPDVPGATLVQGWFDQTLPGFLAEHPGPVDLLHVDGDLYSSAATVLELVGPRLRPGSIVQFDEYLNYPGWQEHEHRAWTEHVARTGVTFEPVAFTHDHEQVAVRITGTD